MHIGMFAVSKFEDFSTGESFEVDRSIELVDQLVTCFTFVLVWLSLVEKVSSLGQNKIDYYVNK